MARDFLGTGWSYPVATDKQGDIRMEEAADNIERSVRIILSTAKGERVMRPEFGCDIHDQVFSSLSPATLNRIEEAVRDALVRWEPRISVDRVSAEPDPNTPNKVLVEVDYWIESTNSHENMVYPFFTTERQR